MKERNNLSDDDALNYRNQLIIWWNFVWTMRRRRLSEYYKKRTFNRFLDKRKDFMRGKINESQFKTAIKKIDKVESFNWEIYQILDTVCIIYEEKFREICEESTTLEMDQLILDLKKFEDLQKLYNTYLRRVAVVYGLKYYPRIHTWNHLGGRNKSTISLSSFRV